MVRREGAAGGANSLVSGLLNLDRTVEVDQQLHAFCIEVLGPFAENIARGRFLDNQLFPARPTMLELALWHDIGVNLLVRGLAIQWITMHVNDFMVDIRDFGPYSTRYTKQGSLLQESRRILQAFSTGARTPEVREGVLAGRILHQGSWNTRRHIWSAFQYRFLTGTPTWVLDELVTAATSQEQSWLTSVSYLYFCLRDRLTFDFVTKVIWPSTAMANFSLSLNDVLTFLDAATEQEPQIRRWTMSTRSKLASMLLSGLRGFGVLEGVNKKRISLPPLPSNTAVHLLRLLISRGVPPSDIVDAPEWHLFLRPGDVALESLRADAPSFGIKLTRSERAFMVEFPLEWSDPRAHV